MAGKPTQQRERDNIVSSREGGILRQGREVQSEFADQIDNILQGDRSEPITEGEANRLLDAMRRLPDLIGPLTLESSEDMGLAFLRADLQGRSQVGDVLANEGAEAQFSAPTALPGTFTPDEAFAWISKQISITRAQFDQLALELQQQAFTVGRKANLDQIERMRGFLERQLTGGVVSKRAFINKFKSQFAESHLQTVYRTNMHSNFEAGKRDMIMKQVNRGAVAFLRWQTARDFRVRDEHKPLQGFTAPPDDPIWSQIWPPAGYNCRCTVTVISNRDAERFNVSASPSSHYAYGFTPDFTPPSRASRAALARSQAQAAESTENRVRR